MGTVVYQGLHESQFVESRPQNILRLRLLSSPRPLKHNTTDKLCEEISQKTSTLLNSSNTTPDSGGWSFLQALENISDESKEQSCYVHPLAKRSSSALSEKSLELCTESLGSESGSDIIEETIFGSETNTIRNSLEGNSPTREQKIMKPPRQVFGADRKVSCHSFPPPLTTMSGTKSIQVRPHREDGRLVIEAIKNPSTQTYFQAERSHGRLILTFVKDFTSIFDSTNVTSSEDRNEEEDHENGVVNYDADQEYEEKQEEETEDEGDEEEMGMDELQRLSRCKQGELEKQKEIIISNWKHLCVATS